MLPFPEIPGTAASASTRSLPLPSWRWFSFYGSSFQIFQIGVRQQGAHLGDGGRDERLLDGVGVDAVVDLGEGALEVPLQLEAVVFLVLEALELLDEVELELDGNPRGELEGDVLVCVGASVAASTGNDAVGSRFLDPMLWCKDETVQPSLNFNSVEFDGVNCGRFAIVGTSLSLLIGAES